MPSPHSSNDFIGAAVQVKGLGSLFVSATKRFGDGSEHASLEASARELGEEAFDGVDQDAEVGAKWNV